MPKSKFKALSCIGTKPGGPAEQDITLLKLRQCYKTDETPKLLNLYTTGVYNAAEFEAMLPI